MKKKVFLCIKNTKNVCVCVCVYIYIYIYIYIYLSIKRQKSDNVLTAYFTIPHVVGKKKISFQDGELIK